MNDVLDRQVEKAIMDATSTVKERQRPFMRTDEPADTGQVVNHPAAEAKKRLFNEVGGNHLFVGYRMVDHLKLFRASYTRRQISVRGVTTDIYVAVIHASSPTNPDEIETTVKTFAEAAQAGAFISIHYAAIELPYLLHDILGTSPESSADSVTRMEAEYIESEFPPV